ncbi:unnamed protein product [Owenia fusiformis]|uniref:Aminopeptidase NAALADL1 n=1 Tax=Owenia fusiformis TaxID=6347 RepID=A0A8S4PDY0_OWEFU|nr:unnamed protein product [Owenia fusiformis]
MSKKLSSRLVVILAILTGVLIFGLGILIGVFIPKQTANTGDTSATYRRLIKDADPRFAQWVHDEISAEKFEEHLKFFSSIPHTAGTPEDFQQADYLRTKWLEFGLDETSLVPYDVLLSYPGDIHTNPNKVEVFEGTDLVSVSEPVEPPADPVMVNRTGIVAPFLAYTPSGVVQGELVYANQATIEDFEKLKNDFNITVKDKIVLAMYGGIHRGPKITNAYNQGAKGLIVFQDPKDYVKGDKKVFPQGQWLPPYGVLRGGSGIAGYGDMLTPAYPSLDFIPRKRIDELPLREIPAQPIGYGDAKKLFDSMSLASLRAPEGWTGNINTTYRLGPNMINNRTVKLTVNNKNERRTIYNTIGIIKGSVEPDRYIIIGNHRDAWNFGAIDNTQGTALLHEFARVFGALLNQGWRPRRSIIFASWSGEEYGLLGSTEFMEEFSKTLAERTVAYINVDILATGRERFNMASSPLHKKVVLHASKKTESPNSTYASLYDFWVTSQNKDPKTEEPSIGGFGAGSDYAPFFQRLGVPCINAGSFSGEGYALYHTLYEVFNLVKNIIDPSFNYQTTAVRNVAEIVMKLADELILPIDVNDYAKDIKTKLEQTKSFEDTLNENDIFLDKLNEAVNNFTRATEAFNEELANLDKTDPIAMRMANDKMMLLESSFIDPLGLPGRPLYRHIISTYSSSGKGGFPGIVDAMTFAMEATQNEAAQKWREVKMEVAKVIISTVGSTKGLNSCRNSHTIPVEMNILGLIEVPNILLIVAGVLIAIYIKWKWDFSLWSSQGIKGPATFPIVGTFWIYFSDKAGLIKIDPYYYQKYKKNKVYGTYDGTLPNLFIADPEMIKKVLVKDFQYFTNRRKIHPMFGKLICNMITALEDTEWKHTRAVMSQAFTSGKLKRMVDNLNVYNNIFLERLGEKADSDEIFEMKEMASECTMDMVAAVAFGFDANVQKNPDSDFPSHAKVFFEFSALRVFAMIAPIILPILAPLIQKLKLADTPPKTVKFYEDIMAQAVTNRKADQNKQNDFLQLMIDSLDAENETKKLDKEVVLSNSVVFLLAGYDSVASVIGWVAYELALHQDVQEKVFEEITELLGDEDEISYEMLNKMTYLETVIEETMRLFPNAPRTDRRCGETVTIDGVTIPKDAIVSIPIYALHHDPDIYPEPEKFIPERFSQEEKAKRNPYFYQPFGMGPRNCVAMRLAQIEVRLCIANMVRKLKILPCEKTEDPIELKPTGQMHPKNGIFLKVARR